MLCASFNAQPVYSDTAWLLHPQQRRLACGLTTNTKPMPGGCCAVLQASHTPSSGGLTPFLHPSKAHECALGTGAMHFDMRSLQEGAVIRNYKHVLHKKARCRTCCDDNML